MDNNISVSGYGRCLLSYKDVFSYVTACIIVHILGNFMNYIFFVKCDTYEADVLLFAVKGSIF